MNREQRRKAGVKGHVPTYNYTKQQLDDAIEKAIHEQYKEISQKVIKETCERVFVTFCIALHDKFGFGQQRLNRLLKEVNKQFECVDYGEVSLEDMMQWCNEYGVKFKD